MDDVARVDVLDTAQQLVEEVLHVVVAERLVAVYELLQVRLHEFEHYQQVVEALRVDWAAVSLAG